MDSPVDKLTDIALVAQVVTLHNKRAFDTLVKKYQSGVRRFLLHQTLGDSQLSDDLAQDTFVKAYTHLSSFKGVSAFSTWLYRIVYNVFYDYRRTHHLSVDIDTVEMRQRASAHPDKALQLDLYKALAQLKEVERLCITLQLVEGQPVEQIAKITGLNLGTVKSHLSRGKTKLATYLKANGYDR